MPSLSALRAFEAAAAHQSFQRAAQELSVTPTAVSHHVRGLEQRLGESLFQRFPRRLQLTPSGVRLFRAVKDGLDTIESGVAALQRATSGQVLTLTTNTAFAARWLLPRMASLRAACPGVQLRLDATESLTDLARGEADLAVRSGDGHWPGLTVQPLALEHYAPMCSPGLGVKKASELALHTLVHVVWQQNAKAPAVWSRWFREAGHRPGANQASLTFSDETQAVLAVLAGQGVGLLSLTLMAEELQQGLLVQPFGPALATGGYFLAAASGREREPPVAAVWEWFRTNLM
jgi:LysR family transcriptional regulator, glycine cleavage system transcriptional activator